MADDFTREKNALQSVKMFQVVSLWVKKWLNIMKKKIIVFTFVDLFLAIFYLYID